MTLHAKTLVEHKSWHADNCIMATCAFTPGSCSLTGYRLTSAGFSWAKNNKDVNNPSPAGYKGEFAERVQLLLSDIFLGYFVCPEGGIWNYHFHGSKFRPEMK